MNENVKDDGSVITAIVGESKKIKIKDEIYTISACPVAELPLLQKKLGQLERIQSGDEINEETLKVMAEIAVMGLKEHHPDMTVEKIMKKFSLGAFPVIIRIMLDLNDFLSGMQELRSRAQKAKELVV